MEIFGFPLSLKCIMELTLYLLRHQLHTKVLLSSQYSLILSDQDIQIWTQIFAEKGGALKVKMRCSGAETQDNVIYIL